MTFLAAQSGIAMFFFFHNENDCEKSYCGFNHKENGVYLWLNDYFQPQ